MVKGRNRPDPGPVGNPAVDSAGELEKLRDEIRRLERTREETRKRLERFEAGKR